MSTSFSLEPVLEAELHLGLPLNVGSVASGTPVTCVPFVGGLLRSVKDGILSDLVDAECVNGLDVSRADPSFLWTRLAVNSLWRNKDNSIIMLSYEALIPLTEEIKAIFTGQATVKATKFGNVFATMKFETGDAKLKALEENQFVASGRFIIEDGSPLKVEYKISRLVDQ